MNGMILKSIAWALVLGLSLWGPGVSAATAQVAELDTLRDWDPTFHAAVEALVVEDPDMANKEFREICIGLAVGCKEDPRAQTELVREVQVMSLQGVDPKTVIAPEVRAKTQEIYTQWKEETSAKLTELRRTDPEKARQLESQLREGKLQMDAFESGERYVPSAQMREEAKKTFEQWKETALAEGRMSKETLRAMEMEFMHWTEGSMGMGPMMGRGSDPAMEARMRGADYRGPMPAMPQNVHYNEKGQLMVMDPKTGISKQWDRATMGEPPVPMGQPSYEHSGTWPSGDMGMPPGDPRTWTDAQRAQYEAMRTGGPMSQADMEAMRRESMARQHLGGGWERSTWTPPGDPATWTPEQRASYDAQRSHWEGGSTSGGWTSGGSGWEGGGGSNWGVNPATGGWEPGMGGNMGGSTSGGWTGGSTWEGGSTSGGWTSGGSTTTWEGGSTTSGGWTSGGSTTWEGSSTTGGGTTYYSSTENHNYSTAQECKNVHVHDDGSKHCHDGI